MSSPAKSQVAKVIPLPSKAPQKVVRELQAPRPDLDDTELLSAVLRGDASAASALHDRVRPQVDRTVYRLFGKRDVDHEDVVQLALIAIVQSIPQFRGECSLDTWTSRITAHTVFKEIRRRKVVRRIFDTSSELSEDHPDPCNLEQNTSQRNLIHRVRMHLNAIDEQRAWTLMLHDVCGYDLREIAQITNISIAAAQSRLVRGRKELQARLERDTELAELLQSGQSGPSGHSNSRGSQ